MESLVVFLLAIFVWILLSDTIYYGDVSFGGFVVL